MLEGRRARRDRQLLDLDPAVAAAKLLRRARPRHQGARRRRRAHDAGHPHPRPDAEPRRPRRRGRGASRAPRRCTAWRRRTSCARPCASPAAPSASSTRRQPPIPAAPSGSSSSATKGTAALAGTELVRALPRRPRTRKTRRTRRRAAPAPTPWRSRTTITSPSGATSSMPSTAAGPRASPAREALAVHRLIDALLAAGTTGRSVMVRGMVR